MTVNEPFAMAEHRNPSDDLSSIASSQQRDVLLLDHHLSLLQQCDAAVCRRKSFVVFERRVCDMLWWECACRRKQVIWRHQFWLELCQVVVVTGCVVL